MQHTLGHAVYKNVENSVDVEYKIQGDGIKENIIVKEKSEKYVYEFMMYIQGLGMRLSEEKNRIELFANRDGIEDIEYVIPVPYMYPKWERSFFTLMPALEIMVAKQS